MRRTWIRYALVGATVSWGCGGDDSTQATGADTTFGDPMSTSSRPNPSTTVTSDPTLDGGSVDVDDGSTFDDGPFPTDDGPFTTTGPDTDSDTATDTGIMPMFPPPEPFGDDVQETDLVGLWGLNWNPQSGFDSTLDIDASGNFIWRETSADCQTETLATGFMWVEASVQVVMHVETWERPLPWDTVAMIGESFPPPFRLRLSFSLQARGGDAYMSLASLPTLTAIAPYEGRSAVRLTTDGAYLGGQWRGEAELFAARAGQMTPEVIVRDVYEAFFDPEAMAGQQFGTGVDRLTRTWFAANPQMQETAFSIANWQCEGICDPGSGDATLVQPTAVSHIYGPYSGFTHLMPFESGRVFQRGAASDCP